MRNTDAQSLAAWTPHMNYAMPHIRGQLGKCRHPTMVKSVNTGRCNLLQFYYYLYAVMPPAKPAIWLQRKQRWEHKTPACASPVAEQASRQELCLARGIAAHRFHQVVGHLEMPVHNCFASRARIGNGKPRWHHVTPCGLDLRL